MFGFNFDRRTLYIILGILVVSNSTEEPLPQAAVVKANAKTAINFNNFFI